MASFHRLKKCRTWVVDIRVDGRTARIRLGKVRRIAAGAFAMIEELDESRRYAIEPSPDARRWAESISGQLKRRLSELGIVTTVAHTIGDLLDQVEAKNVGKANTVRVRAQSYRSAEKFFGRERTLASITQADGIDFLDWMKREGGRDRKGNFDGSPTSEATASKRFKTTRSALSYAVSAKWISDNPLDGIKAGKQSNRSRDFTFGRKLTARILEEIPRGEIRTAFALARWGGLRCPSEVVGLRWSWFNCWLLKESL